MINLLDHPELREIEPETEREALLCLKIYITAIEATLSAVREFGLDQAEKTQREIMVKFAQKAGLVDNNEEASS